MQGENSQELPRACGWLLPALMAVALGWLCWRAWCDPKIQFLPPGSAPWIVYPSPPQTFALDALNLPAEFHTQFVLARQPAKAMLDWRCFRHGRLSVNGRVVTIPASANWKVAAQVDVASQLNQGTNDLRATVWADTGPPALSLRLQTDVATMRTDESWGVSLAGARQLPARQAGVTVEPMPGNSLFGGERTAPSLSRTLGFQCIFLGVSVLATLICFRLRGQVEGEGRRAKCLRNLAGGCLAIAWVVLLAHNFGYLSLGLGFDGPAHLEYIKYIQTTGSLPPADQGWETYQPPLYYAISSCLLDALHCAPTEVAGMRVLCCFNLVVGAANIALVFAGLRMVFPGQWKKQILGTALAAFTPWHLCLLHFPTNEVLAAMLGTASICLCLKCLQPGQLSLPRCVALGIALGAAGLTKASAVVLLPVIFVALAARLLSERKFSPAVWARTFGLVFVLVPAISGWHYWGLWSRFGTPLAGNWTPGVAPPWWQSPGYRTPAYFLSFGRSFVAPFFSSFDSFWDGLHSTLWGDGLWGGRTNIVDRPPWNYDLMAVGFVLALAPAVLICSGAVVEVVRFTRRPRPEWLLLMGVAALFFFAIAFMTLKLPYYGQTKAFYALAALLPISALAISGLEFWAKRSRFVTWTILVVTGAWFLNNYAAFWILPDAPQTRFLLASDQFLSNRNEAIQGFERLLSEDPGNAAAAEHLARAELIEGRVDLFEATVAQAIKTNAVNGKMASLAAQHLVDGGHWRKALELAARVARDAPDDEVIAQTWLNLAYASHQDAEVVAAAAWLLRDSPGNLRAHKVMAEALNHLGQTNAAAMHLSIGQATSF
jgi:hypothetical protein